MDLKLRKQKKKQLKMIVINFIVTLPRTGPRPASSMPSTQGDDLAWEGTFDLKTQLLSQVFKNWSRFMLFFFE